MKRLSTFSLILCSLILFTSNRIGRGKAAGPATTAPGESGQYCGSFGCHFSGNFDPELQLSLINEEGISVDEYTPGESYKVQLIIDHSGLPAGFGFQMVALKDEDNTAINNFSNLPPGTHEINLFNRQYVEHSQRLLNDTIILDWSAPESGTGDVGFYAAGNAVNGNNTSSGDGADTTQLHIPEKMTSSLNAFDWANQVNVYPNPANELIHISGRMDFINIEILDFNGQGIFQSNNSEISLSNISSGIYLIRINYPDGVVVKKLIKV
ncbi:MAG: T9SS type A sorting domain-containing protein [Saprospiraceae bacterium]|nr:T9SS type A sorting domain-containing protein [Saprospiraceae bacterium]